jgi:hypothetical protein
MRGGKPEDLGKKVLDDGDWKGVLLNYQRRMEQEKEQQIHHCDHFADPYFWKCYDVLLKDV